MVSVKRVASFQEALEGVEYNIYIPIMGKDIAEKLLMHLLMTININCSFSLAKIH